MAKDTKKDFIFAVGRRRESVARIRLYPSGSSVVWGEKTAQKGDFLVNGRLAKDYFASQTAEASYNEPLRTANLLGKVIVTVRVQGGGLSGQLGAVVHGLSRALSELDIKHRAVLKKRGFLTRDPRTRQRRKVGMGGKSRRKKQSPKR